MLQQPGFVEGGDELGSAGFGVDPGGAGVAVPNELGEDVVLAAAVGSDGPIPVAERVGGAGRQLDVPVRPGL